MTLEEEASRRLHERVTRGEALSEMEQQQLERWYAHHDLAEAALLGAPRKEAQLAELETRISTTLERIAATTRQIQDIADETSLLRRENEDLKRRLASVVYGTHR